MRTHALGILTLGLLLATGQPQDVVKREKQKLQGTWSMISREMGGERTQGKELENNQIVFDGDKLFIRVKDKNENHEFSFTLAPKANPSRLDFADKDKKQYAHCIYTLDQDKLTLCLAPDEAPKEFTTKPGSRIVLSVFKRVKP